MPDLPYDRLVRKEVALGVLREFEPPQDHIGLRLIAPFMDVESDDVIFDYVRGETAGLAPARAEDAESEMAGKDESVGTGRASLIDWALKDHYDPSDVSRYRESLQIGAIAGAANVPLTWAGRANAEWQAKLARDLRRRRRFLDNRLEWLIMEGLVKNQIAYNDGKILFDVSFGRPANQHEEAVEHGWDQPDGDPIGVIEDVKQFMLDTYGVRITRAITSTKVMRALPSTTKFTNDLIGSNPLYTQAAWTVDSARQVIEAKTGVVFSPYDSVYRTRPLGSNTITNTRFTDENTVIFLPDAADLAELDDAIGFAKTLTSPHPEGNWTSGFYEWERDTVDPWSHDIGAGIKAFPVFLHNELTYTVKVFTEGGSLGA